MTEGEDLGEILLLKAFLKALETYFFIYSKTVKGNVMLAECPHLLLTIVMEGCNKDKDSKY